MKARTRISILTTLFFTCTLLLLITESICAQEHGTTAEEQVGLRALASALSVGIGCIAASYAVGKTGTAAVGAITERPEIFGKAIIFVGLAEGIAIYGLLVAILLLP